MNENKSYRMREYTKKFTLIYILTAILCAGVGLIVALTCLKLAGEESGSPAKPTAPSTAASTEKPETPGVTAGEKKTDAPETTFVPQIKIFTDTYDKSLLGKGIFAIPSETQPCAVPSSGKLTNIYSVREDRVIKVAYSYYYLTDSAFLALNGLQKGMKEAFPDTEMVITVTYSYQYDPNPESPKNPSEAEEYGTGNAMNIKFMDSKASYQLGDAKVADLTAWIKNNAHKYGLIIRYPEGKSEQTGKPAETKHLRFVGKEVASYMYENDLCLEEFLTVIQKYSFNKPLELDGADGDEKLRIYFTKLEADGNAEVSYRGDNESESYGDLSVSGGIGGFVVLQSYRKK